MRGFLEFVDPLLRFIVTLKLFSKSSYLSRLLVALVYVFFYPHVTAT